MKQSAIALIIGVLLGAAGSSFFSRGSDSYTEPRAQSGAVATLPALPEPYYTVLFENDAVRIVDHVLEVGDSEPEHTHAPMVAYFVEGATVMITEANDSTWQRCVAERDAGILPARPERCVDPAASASRRSRYRHKKEAA